ncbi:hypothetical protein D3C86_2035110 [compost metagenome]
MLTGFVKDDIPLLVNQQNIPFFQRCCFPENLIQQIRLHIHHQIADILQRVVILNDSGLHQHRLA